MAQVFHRSLNSISRFGIVGGAILAAGVALGLAAAYRSSLVTQVNISRAQPVPFSHKHHVNGLGLDCRYCHTSVESSPFAGIPPTQICMNCHSQIWSDSPMLEPVRKSFRTGEPLHWTRINDVPDFVYFNHSIHVHKGIGCETCHGRVDRMPLTWKANPLYMKWCLACHRAPEEYVRPREEVFTMGWKPAEDQDLLGARLVKEYHIQKLTHCSVCHR